jgi:hypothetical protein
LERRIWEEMREKEREEGEREGEGRWRGSCAEEVWG